MNMAREGQGCLCPTVQARPDNLCIAFITFETPDSQVGVAVNSLLLSGLIDLYIIRKAVEQDIMFGGKKKDLLFYSSPFPKMWERCVKQQKINKNRMQ